MKPTGAIQKSITEILDKLRLRGYFPGMTDMVTLIANNCISCLQKSNQIPHRKRNCIAQGKIVKHILTVLDGFTRYIVAIPIPDLESSTSLNAFVEGFCLKFGIPEVVHSDNGTSLLSKQFQDSLMQMSVQTTQTPTYSPQEIK